MFRKHLARRIEKVWDSYRTELCWAIQRVNRKLGDDEFSEEKRKLFSQAIDKGNYSSPVVREWVDLAERCHPIKPWRRIFRLDGGGKRGLPRRKEISS